MDCAWVRRAHQRKSSDAALFPDVPGQQGGAALPGAAGRHPPGHFIRFARGPGEIRQTKEADLTSEHYEWLQRAVARGR